MSGFDAAETSPDVSTPGDLPAPAGSGLEALRGRRAKVVESLHIDMPVPDSEELLGTKVVVRYRPCTKAEIVSTQGQFKKSRDDDKDTQANAVLLAKCCLGIFTAEERDNPDQWLRFDTTLAAIIEDVEEADVKAKSSKDVVRALYFLDGHVDTTAERLIRFSGYDLDELEVLSPGN